MDLSPESPKRVCFQSFVEIPSDQDSGPYTVSDFTDGIVQQVQLITTGKEFHEGDWRADVCQEKNKVMLYWESESSMPSLPDPPGKNTWRGKDTFIDYLPNYFISPEDLPEAVRQTRQAILLKYTFQDATDCLVVVYPVLPPLRTHPVYASKRDVQMVCSSSKRILALVGENMAHILDGLRNRRPVGQISSSEENLNVIQGDVLDLEGNETPFDKIHLVCHKPLPAAAKANSDEEDVHMTLFQLLTKNCLSSETDLTIWAPSEGDDTPRPVELGRGLLLPSEWRESICPKVELLNECFMRCPGIVLREKAKEFGFLKGWNILPAKRT